MLTNRGRWWVHQGTTVPWKMNRKDKRTYQKPIFQPHSNKASDTQNIECRLDAFNCKLEDLDRSFCEVGSITTLVLSGLKGGILPPEIVLLSGLNQLHIRNSTLTEIPSELGMMTWVNDLEISNNYLTLFPSEIGNMRKLENLIIYDSLLDYIPSELGFLTSLSSLTMDLQSLRFATAFTRLPRLEVLRLESSNKIGDEFFPMPGLGWRPVGTIPSELGQFSNVQFSRSKVH